MLPHVEIAWASKGEVTPGRCLSFTQARFVATCSALFFFSKLLLLRPVHVLMIYEHCGWMLSRDCLVEVRHGKRVGCEIIATVYVPPLCTGGLLHQ